MVNNLYISNKNCERTYVYNLNLSNLNIERGGVILYTFIDNNIYFGFGVDNKSKDLTDFGGGIKKRDGNAIRGCLREFQEESLGIFKKLTYDDVKMSPVIYNRHSMIIFIKHNLDCNYIRETFINCSQEFIKNNKKIEIIDIKWISLNLLHELLSCDNSKNIKIYNRVANMLKQVVNYLKFLP